ncbi:MAG: hypothetical protein JEY94_05200 [Melioribacteraceae bacterium]|nr:hypothetical protein [Melioribacteraceae bacterium]
MFSENAPRTEVLTLQIMVNLVAELQTAETDFATTRVAYETAVVNDNKKENATTLKKETALIINEQLVVYLKAMAQVDKTKYENFALLIGQIIDETNEQVKRRRENNKPDAEEG